MVVLFDIGGVYGVLSGLLFWKHRLYDTPEFVRQDLAVSTMMERAHLPIGGPSLAIFPLLLTLELSLLSGTMPKKLARWSESGKRLMSPMLGAEQGGQVIVHSWNGHEQLDFSALLHQSQTT